MLLNVLIERIRTAKLSLGTALIAIIFAATNPVAMEAKLLKGSVEEENLRLHSPGFARPQSGAASDSLRISRAPSALKGSAVDASAFADEAPTRSPLNGSAVDDSQFAAPPPKSFDIGADRGSREMTLAWEKWHHQLSEAIYTRWQQRAREPGKATIRITVTRDRIITAQILEGRGGPEFIDVVMSAIASLNGNPGLTFPAKSERQQVSFEADYIAASNVTPGYSWVKNDVERIRHDY